MTGSGTAELNKVLAAIQKKYKGDEIGFASKEEEVERIPTGIIEIDALTGGGLPFGRWSHIYGPFSSGKTLISLHLIAQAQKLGYTCAFYDVENSFNREWAKNIGVDVDALVHVDGSIIEELGEKLYALMDVVNIHIIDSVAAGVAMMEVENDTEKYQMAAIARSWAKVIRKANSFFDKKKNMIVMLNHSTKDFGNTWNFEEVPVGGRHINFISSCSLLLDKRFKDMYFDENGYLSFDAPKTEGMHGQAKPDGKEINVKLTKSKIGTPLASTKIRMIFGPEGQYDQTWSLVKAAIYYGIVKQGGAWYELPDGSKVQGETKLRKEIETNEKLRQQIIEVYLNG